MLQGLSALRTRVTGTPHVGTVGTIAATAQRGTAVNGELPVRSLNDIAPCCRSQAAVTGLIESARCSSVKALTCEAGLNVMAVGFRWASASAPAVAVRSPSLSSPPGRTHRANSLRAVIA